ncbi:MAG: hypothetical protein NC324_02365 [Bacteroides sp.]|nr:hypothetical protein [Bacteroides sp.]
MFEINHLSGRVTIRTRNEMLKMAKTFGNSGSLTTGGITIHLNGDGTHTLRGDIVPADYVCVAITGMGKAASLALDDLIGFCTVGKITYFLIENNNGEEIRLRLSGFYIGLREVIQPNSMIIPSNERKEVSIFLMNEKCAVLTISEPLNKNINGNINLKS